MNYTLIKKEIEEDHQRQIEAQINSHYLASLEDLGIEQLNSEEVK